MNDTIWHEFWKEGNTPWVNERSDEFLRTRFEEIKKFLPKDPKECRVLIPLCGNSQAVRILYDLGMDVTGVELVPEAIQSLREQHLRDLPLNEHSGSLIGERLRIALTDIHSFESTDQFDFIYDRAALVALNPKTEQRPYAEKISSLLSLHGILQIEGFSTPQGVLGGPPYETPRELPRSYYSHLEERACFVEERTTENPRFLEQGVEHLLVYWIIFSKSSVG